MSIYYYTDVTIINSINGTNMKDIKAQLALLISIRDGSITYAELAKRAITVDESGYPDHTLCHVKTTEPDVIDRFLSAVCYRAGETAIVVSETLAKKPKHPLIISCSETLDEIIDYLGKPYLPDVNVKRFVKKTLYGSNDELTHVHAQMKESAIINQDRFNGVAMEDGNFLIKTKSGFLIVQDDYPPYIQLTIRETRTVYKPRIFVDSRA